MTVLWSPPKPRLHDRARVRVPKRREIQHQFLADVAAAFLQRLLDRAPPPMLAAFIDHEDRATRSDWLESIYLVVYCLLASTSLKSLRIGHRTKKVRGGWKHDFVGLRVDTIAEQTGRHRDTVSAVLTLLRECGYLFGPSDDGVNHIAQPWERREDGSFKPLPAIRRFTFVFFAELGPYYGRTLNKIRTSKPRCPPPPTVAADVVQALTANLAHHHALDGPPDS